jgi:nucleotide-binding universal stress UspA family protein
MLPLESILYPTDFSENASQALPYLKKMAGCFGAKVYFLHVLETTLQAADMSWSAAPPVMDEKLEANAMERLRRLAQDSGLPEDQWNVAVTKGHPSLEITRYAREHGLGMIVMSTHGHSGLSHFLLGSVTERVVRKSPCPVLTVRADLEEMESAT